MDYSVIRSFRKTVSIQIKEDGSLEVRAPYFLSERKIQKILFEKSKLIQKKVDQMRMAPQIPAISKKDVEKLRQKAKDYILPRVKMWSEKTDLPYTAVRITSARGRFGSCNRNRSLCFSLFLMLAEEKEIDYVILHELCHTKEMNHSDRFYALVSTFMPDYKERQKNLRKLVIPKILNEKG